MGPFRCQKMPRSRAYFFPNPLKIITAARSIAPISRDATLFSMMGWSKNWIGAAKLRSESFLFPSRLHKSEHLSTRQYGRIVDGWVTSIGLDPSAYGTHSMRRTKASLIYRRTGNLRAVQLLLGHTKIESTVRYLGIEVDDALEMAERTEV